MGNYIQKEFIECDECRIKPGSPLLCTDCLDRRNYYSKHGKCRAPKQCTPEVQARARAYDEYWEIKAKEYWESIENNE